MNRANRSCFEIVVAGFGSPHGDDQAGWQVIDLLKQRPYLQTRLVSVYELTQFLEQLDGCSTLIVVDGCRSGARPGTISRLGWPDERIVERHGNSTHALGVVHALRLAEALGQLPETVLVYGIEIEECVPGRALSAEVAEALQELEQIVAAELCEPVHA